LIAQAPKNGIDTPFSLEQDIQQVCHQLADINPNPKPCCVTLPKSSTTQNDGGPLSWTSSSSSSSSLLLNGFWYMLWTNYSPAGPSSGKLGPFVGNVYQELILVTDDESTAANTTTASTAHTNSAVARNIFRLDFPPIMGELMASPRVYNDTTVAITFEKVGTKVAGLFPLGPNIQFKPNKEVRLWDHIYVDDQYRILYASNAATKAGTDANPRYLYIMKRADHERFVTNI
jgi:hypothetical protein